MNRIRIMRAYFIMAVAIGSLALGGCAATGSSGGALQASQYGLEAAQVANALVSAKPQIATAESIVASKWSTFTPAEQASLSVAKTNINAVVSDVDRLGANSHATGTTILVNLGSLTAIYSSARMAYLSAKAVIVAHQSAFSPAQLAQLQQLDVTAKTLDAAVQKLLAVPATTNTNITPIVLNALQTALLVAKITAATGA